MSGSSSYGAAEERQIAAESAEDTAAATAQPATVPQALTDLAVHLLTTVRELDKLVDARAAAAAAPLIKQAEDWAAGKVKTAEARATRARDLAAERQKIIDARDKVIRGLKRDLATQATDKEGT